MLRHLQLFSLSSVRALYLQLGCLAASPERQPSVNAGRWGGGAPTCYWGRAGRLHGVTLLGEGLNAGETRQTRQGEARYADLMY